MRAPHQHTRVEGNVTETPRETRVLDAVVSLVDTLLEDFDVVVPSLPGYGFSPRPLEVGINYRYVSERWHGLMTALDIPATLQEALTSAPG